MLNLIRKAMINLSKKDHRFPPCMPDVDTNRDIAEVFAEARAILSIDHPKRVYAGKTCMVFVSPDRTMSLLAGPEVGSFPDGFVATAKSFIPSSRPLNITAVAFTGLKAPDPKEIIRVLFIAGLINFAYIGHSVVIFEGHESGFKAALKGADALVIDSGMLPFLQRNWFEVAQRVFQGKGRIRVFDVKAPEGFRAVVKAKWERGWDYATEPDGERSYVNALLTTLGKRPSIAVELREGEPLPDPATLAVDPDEIEWTSMLPFQYDTLNVEEVIRTIAQSGVQWSPPEGSRAEGTVKMELLKAGGVVDRMVAFQLVLTDYGTAGARLRIERSD